MNPAPPTFRATMMDLNRPEPQLVPHGSQVQGSRRFQAIEKAVAVAFDLSVETLHGRSRIIAHAWPRQVAYCMLREFARANNCEIGRHFGRSHNAITTGIKHVTDLQDVYPKVRVELDSIRLQVKHRIASL